MDVCDDYHGQLAGGGMQRVGEGSPLERQHQCSVNNTTQTGECNEISFETHSLVLDH